MKIRAARTGMGESALIEDALRREFGLDVLERMWERTDLPPRGGGRPRGRGAAPYAPQAPADRVVRGVLDPNVLISATLSRRGVPARVLAMWIEGEFELLISPLVVAELSALASAKPPNSSLPRMQQVDRSLSSAPRPSSTIQQCAFRFRCASAATAPARPDRQNNAALVRRRRSAAGRRAGPACRSTAQPILLPVSRRP